MKHFLTAAMTAAVFLLCSCAKEYSPYEVLQVSKYDNLYTCYTLWYTDPMEMTSENIQQGTIIPFGTPVVITKMNEDEVRFDAEGKQFRLMLEDKNMETIHAFVRRTFSTKNADGLVPDASASVFEKMRRGIVSEGMTEDQVIVACGRPPLSRTPNLTNDTWIYQADRVRSRRVIFRKTAKDKPRIVIRVFEL